MIIWLSSYPKSGNTWLRSLLSSYFFTNDGSFNFNILKNIDQFPSAPYFSKYKDLFLKPESTSKFWIKEQININKDKKLRFFKTHNAMCKIDGNSFTDINNTLGAIYIVRDPRKIVSSLSNHYQISTKEAFEFMNTEKKAIIQKIENRYLGFNALFTWQFHVNSWTSCKKFPVLTIKYEELENETFSTFKKVFEFIKRISKMNISFDKDKAKKTIKSCQFERMQNLESKNGFSEAMSNKKTNEKIKFFNLGNKNKYQDLLDKDLINLINLKYQKQLKNFFYE